jgi:hypothetical protein
MKGIEKMLSIISNIRREANHIKFPLFVLFLFSVVLNSKNYCNSSKVFDGYFFVRNRQGLIVKNF